MYKPLKETCLFLLSAFVNTFKRSLMANKTTVNSKLIGRTAYSQQPYGKDSEKLRHESASFFPLRPGKEEEKPHTTQIEKPTENGIQWLLALPPTYSGFSLYIYSIFT